MDRRLTHSIHSGKNVIFGLYMITLDFSGIQLNLKEENDRTMVFDPVRKRWVVLTPEEHVRQYMLGYLIKGMEYSASLIAVEKKIMVGKLAKRFDIIVYNRDHKPWMLIECKEPEVMLSEAALYQLLNYQNVLQCKYWVLTNGHQTYCANAADIRNIRWEEGLPVQDS